MFPIDSQGAAAKDGSKTEKLIKGTLILTIAGFVVKVIGSLNWIFVSRILGGEGIGLYQMAFPIYFLAMTVSQAGVPTAIAIITAERVALKDVYGARRVFRVAISLMFMTGLFFALLTFFGADWLIDSGIVLDGRAKYAIQVLSPAVFLVAMLAGSRGYLQGWQRMTPTAVSQISEQIFRVVAMVVLAALLLPYGLPYAAAGASFGAFAGAAAGLLALVYFHWQLDRDIKRDYGEAAKVPTAEGKEPLSKLLIRMFKLALPVSAASLMLPVVSNLDLFIVPQRLGAAGFSVPQATELFGYLTGMAVPLVNLATILTASMAVSIVPAITEANVLKDKKGVYEQTAAAVRISNFVSFPAFIVMFILATPLATLFYNAPGAGPAVLISAVSIVFLGLHQVTTAVLQGLGHPTIPVVNMILAAVVKVILNWTLTAIPALGIMGAAWATVADMAVAALINLYFIHHYIRYRMELGQLFKTIVSAAVMAGVMYFSYDMSYVMLSSTVVSIFASIFLGLLIYLAVLLALGGIEAYDLLQIPFIGRHAIRFFEKIGFFREKGKVEDK
ncbi:polysaccharide biosynthesis protein [Selenomonas sp. TAMA-11512]|uniref:putative polysaccharide biosynthesis protein n=1 Tax=Selenomonas sp. TAMA-11512 TaxID=3095337 RepID=UPI0030933EA5|nr:polysaccharide biosynthesis protein [Selenomonas sp. TAMA-11512]